jgi:hypothetical protein
VNSTEMLDAFTRLEPIAAALLCDRHRAAASLTMPRQPSS